MRPHECFPNSEIDTPKGFGEFNFNFDSTKINEEVNEDTNFLQKNESGEVPKLLQKMNSLELKQCMRPIEELKNSIGKIGVWVEGDLYFGDFLNGRRNGLALEIFSNGEYYYGYFKEDLFEGEGFLFWN